MNRPALHPLMRAGHGISCRCYPKRAPKRCHTVRHFIGNVLTPVRPRLKAVFHALAPPFLCTMQAFFSAWLYFLFSGGPNPRAVDVCVLHRSREECTGASLPPRQQVRMLGAGSGVARWRGRGGRGTWRGG